MLLISLLTACAPDFQDVQVELSPDMGTVVAVSWVDDGEPSVVQFGPDFSKTAPAVPGDDGRVHALLLGTPQLTELSLRPARTDALQRPGEVHSVLTGLLDPSLPLIEVQQGADLQAQAPYLITTLLAESSGLLVVDRAGEPVWFHPIDDGRMALKVEPTLDETGLLAILQAPETEESGQGELVWFGFDGQVQRSLSLPDAHHGFAQLPDGGLAWLEWESRVTTRDIEYMGEVVMVQPAGQEPRVLATDLELFPDVINNVGERGTHANGLFYDAARDRLLVSFRNLHTVVELDVATGEALELHGKQGTRDFDPQLVAFIAQHSPSVTGDDTLLVFDNGDGEQPTRVREYRIDEDALREVSVIQAGGPVLALGDAVRQSNGHTVVSWGMRGEIWQVDAQGETLWSMSMALGAAPGSVRLLDEGFAGVE